MLLVSTLLVIIWFMKTLKKSRKRERERERKRERDREREREKRLQTTCSREGVAFLS